MWSSVKGGRRREEFVELALELGIAPLEEAAVIAEMEHAEHKASEVRLT